MKDTPNPFVRAQTNPHKFNEISKEITDKTGQNTREEIDKRLGYKSIEKTIIYCPHCKKSIELN